MSGNCAVFCGGDPVSERVFREEYTAGCYNIAADSGYLLAKKLGVKSDIIIGDFDSANRPDSENVIVFPVEKDDTDLMLAIKEGISRGYDRFLIFGATGGRLDHTYAAIQSLAYLLEHGAFGTVISENERIELYKAGRYEFPKKEGMSMSLFAYSGSVGGLTVSGTKYVCESTELSAAFPLGVSNEVKAEKAVVSFEKGLLLVIRSKL